MFTHHCSLLSLKYLRKLFHKRSDFVSNPSIMLKCFFLGGTAASQFRWVVKPHVEPPGFSQKQGAGLVGLVAKGDYVVELDALQGIEMFGDLSGNIDPDLGHDLDGPGVDSMRFDSGGIGIDGIALQMPGPTFRHLAPARIPGAQIKDL